MGDNDLINLLSQIRIDSNASDVGASAYFSSLPPVESQANGPVTSTPLEPEFFGLFPYELVLDVWVDFDDELVEGNPVGYQDEKLNVLR